MAEFSTGQFVDAPDLNPVTFDVGDLKWSARRTSASGWFGPCRGDALSRTTFAELFAAIVPLVGAFTVTLATPGVFTLTAHGLVVGDRVYLTTTGALPTGLSANTIYYVSTVTDANTFRLSATEGGSAINTSGSQSGTHSLYACPYGLGDGSTTFNVPDGAGRSLVGSAGTSGHVSVRAAGQNEGVALANRAQKHNATVVDPTHVHGISPFSIGTTEGHATLVSDFNAGNEGGPFTLMNPASTGVTVGPGGTLPVDQPANLVAHLYIKT